MTIQPIGKAYWIELDVPEAIVERSGLYIAQEVKNVRSETGIIRGISPDAKKYGIKIGDHVLFRKFNISSEATVLPDGTEVIIGADYEKDILAIVLDK
jgi:co-chaperonin GroES (HSP10)